MLSHNFGAKHKKGCEFMSELYNRIENLCSQKNITVTAMCRESGASRASLSDLKVGRKQSLSADTLSKISSFFGVSIDYLLGAPQDGVDISRALNVIMEEYGLSYEEACKIEQTFTPEWCSEKNVRGVYNCFRVYFAERGIFPKEKAPTQEDEREIGFDDFTYAFYEESKDLPDEKKKMLLEMARFMKADIEKEKG